jgi:hypothetical protein
LVGVGTPPAPRGEVGLADGAVLGAPPDLDEEEDGLFFWEGFCLLELGFCDFGRPPERGVVDVVVVREDVEVVPLCVGVLVVGVVPVDTGAHDSDTPTTPAVTGSEICERGVPGGTSTVNDSWAPPTSVTVITHVWAEADGRAAIPITAATEATVIAPTTDFRLLSTVANFLPGASRRRLDHTAACLGRYWLTPGFATVNCSMRAGPLVVGLSNPQRSSRRAGRRCVYRPTSGATVAGAAAQHLCSSSG